MWALSFSAAYTPEGIYICSRGTDIMGTALWRNKDACISRCPKQYADSIGQSKQRGLGGLDVRAVTRF